MSIDTPRITNVQSISVARLPLKIPCSEIQNVMDPGIEEVFAAVATQGLTPAGPLMSYHRHRPTNEFDFEISLPVQGTFQPAGRVTPGQIRAARVATTTFQGPYEKLGDAWGEFQRWIESQNLKASEDLWETYLVAPDTESNPQKYVTQLFQPLVD